MLLKHIGGVEVFCIFALFCVFYVWSHMYCMICPSYVCCIIAPLHVVIFVPGMLTLGCVSYYLLTHVSFILCPSCVCFIGQSMD